MGSLYSLHIFSNFFVSCKSMKGTNKVVVVVASIHYCLTETDITHEDNSLFFIFPPIFERVVKRGSGSFEFCLLVHVILHECHSIRGHSRDVTQ